MNYRLFSPPVILIGVALFLIFKMKDRNEGDAVPETSGKGKVEQSAAGNTRDQTGGGRRESTRSTRILRDANPVVTTASGLKYKVLVEGEGDHPGLTDRVQVHYHGTLEDGTVFDSSVERGAPASFPLTAVIKGWTEGLQLMKPGAKYRFTIPPELAYGEAGAGGKIPPNATLVFEVELLSFARIE